MASIGQKTANLALTQYKQGDTIDFFAEYNTDMRKIDAGVGAKSTVKILGSGEELPPTPDAMTLYLKPTAEGYELYDGTGTKLPVNVLAGNVDVDGTDLPTVLDGKASTDAATADKAGLMSAIDKSDHDEMAEMKTEIGMLTGLEENIITALNRKMAKAGGTFTGTTTVEAVSPIRQWKTQDGKIYYISSGGSGDGAYFDIGTYIEGTAYSMLRFDKDGKVVYVKDQESFRAAIGSCKKLWSGSASSGTITVPGLNNYRVFFCTFEGSSYGIVANRAGSVFGGSTIYVAAGSNPDQYFIHGVLNNENITIVRLGHIGHIAGSAHGQNQEWVPLIAIYGLA